MSSYVFKTEFREYPPILRRAISVGRRIQDPVAEFCGLCVDEDELLCLRLHPRQVILIFLCCSHFFKAYSFSVSVTTAGR